MKEKFTLFLLLVCLSALNSKVRAQQVTLSADRQSLVTVLNEIQRQTKFNFVYSNEARDLSIPVSINVKNVKLMDVLKELFKSQPLSYSVDGNVVILKLKSLAGQEQSSRTIQVTVQDGATNETIIGASIKLKSGGGASTNNIGLAKLAIEDTDKDFVVSFIGYKQQVVLIKENTIKYLVKLEPEDLKLNEVTINSGIFTRKKESFTGATATISAAELRTVGNMNVIESIKSLDPSIIMPDNLNFGSDPNRVAQIEVRGKTSLSRDNLADKFSVDPNQPLFILDGFPTTLRTITDLDMSRIASISILKDAASTSLYGAQAANGVVVVETIKPKPGSVRINYSGDFRVEMYDLRSYNMMNSAEKLEFERRAGRYTESPFLSASLDNGFILDSLYNARLKRVLSGVDTYWLDKPLQTGFSNKHSLYINGGSEEFQYGVGTNYQNVTGTMKGSGRDVWGANIDLSYRKRKINISNQFFINGYEAKDSPYGSFSQYVNINPYYQDNWGNTPPRYLEDSRASEINDPGYRVSNPFYNAQLNSYNKHENFAVQNNLSMNWDINSDLRFTPTLQLGKSIQTITNFVSPENTRFDGVSIYERGTYSNQRYDSFNYQLNGMLTYNKVFKEKHVLTANLRGELFNSQNKLLETAIVGFPAGVEGIPSFGYSYKPDVTPLYNDVTVHRANMLFSVNYAYDNRYLFDATYRLDGSTAFGSAKRYSPFWAVGLGWNLHRESFLKEVDWIDMLRLRGNIGIAGNQNFGSFQSSTVYQFDANTNYFGQGTTIEALGNPNLAWQSTRQISVGTDFAGIQNRLSVTLNAYHKLTDPLIVALNLPSSTGLSDFPLNIGNLTTKGLEAILRYAVIQQMDRDFTWTLGLQGTMYQNKFNGFGSITSNLNQQQLKNNQLNRYLDGFSPDDIWAVPSMGINPANGQEVFLKKNGTYTFIYDDADIVKVGNTRPKVEGVISSNLRYQGFSMGLYLRYRLGADVFNTALYNKVENISVAQIENNQDRRALYDRWQQSGDLARFKSIAINSVTSMSSRFVQKESLLTGESISAGYEFRKDKFGWIKQAGLQSLRFTAYANDIFRLSSIRAERGIDYPFANNLSFSINASF